jgi:hypothetical protein
MVDSDIQSQVVSGPNTVNGNLTVAGAATVNLPDAGSFTVNDDGAVAILTLTDGGAGADTAQLGVGLKVFAGTADAGSAFSFLSAFSTPRTIIGYDSTGALEFDSHTRFYKFLDGGGTVGLAIDSSCKLQTYNAITTAGLGVPAIYKTSSQLANTNAAPTSVAYTPPSTPGTYRASGYIEVTTGTTISLKLKLTYGSPGGTDPVTDGIDFQQQGSITFLTAIVTTGRYFFTMPFAIDNSGTAITLADNSGTYTTCVYNLVYTLEQLA